MCGGARTSHKRLCMPGGGRLDDTAAASDEAASGSTNNTLFVIHAGTNDIVNTTSEELMQNYKRMRQRYRIKYKNVIVSGILLRTRAQTVFHPRGFSTNSRLSSLCAEEGVNFVTLGNNFYDNPSLFQPDGLHLTELEQHNSADSLVTKFLVSDQQTTSRIVQHHTPSQLLA